MDPLAEFPSPYVYCSNSPLRYVDPLGLQSGDNDSLSMDEFSVENILSIIIDPFIDAFSRARSPEYLCDGYSLNKRDDTGVSKNLTPDGFATYFANSYFEKGYGLGDNYYIDNNFTIATGAGITLGYMVDTGGKVSPYIGIAGGFGAAHSITFSNSGVAGGINVGVQPQWFVFTIQEGIGFRNSSGFIEYGISQPVSLVPTGSASLFYVFKKE